MSRAADHVEAFNRAVTTGDWPAFAERFAADARMAFVGVPAGPYVGRPAILAAYQANPPAETMVLIGAGKQAEAAAEAVRFRWAGGGTGTMSIVWGTDGHVQELTVAFD
ncbi:nuclear transport factor 2 family protein [Kribbella sandramycini]|nr:DUF4440 domain-containing protein [Kribbella sandramycini]MBB6570150.1 hypothetical protein [Kribbella sandramycini]